MAQRQEIAAVYAAAVVQGITLVTFPAVSSVLTSPAHYGLSTSEYGTMFVPQAVTAVLASFLGAALARRLGGRWMLLGGLAADLVAMALLFASQFLAGQHALAYGFLLMATGFLGGGFGLVVPALNTFTAAFFPARVDRAILTLNALLGVGTALAPIFSAGFVGLGIWWGLPVLMCGLTFALLLFALRLPLDEGSAHQATSASRGEHGVPRRFWLYAAFALVYGVCETLNGNWASVYLTAGIGASTTVASLALTVFWVSVTGGRVLFAATEKWCPSAWTYRGLPLLLVLAFVATSLAPRGNPAFALICFGVAGLGCSALLPLVVSFGQSELTALGAGVAGSLIGCYQIGYGIAAFGVGPAQRWTDATLGHLYGWTAVLALGLAALAFSIISKTEHQ